MNSNAPLFRQARFTPAPDDFKQKLFDRIDALPPAELPRVIIVPPSRNIYRLPLLITTSACVAVFVALVASGTLFVGYEKISDKITAVTQKVEMIYHKK